MASVDNDWQLAKISKFKEYDVMRINGQPFFNRIVFVNKKAMPKIYMNEPKCETQELFNLKKAGDNYPLYLGLVPLNQESELLRELKAKEDKDYSNNVYLSIFCSFYLYMPNNWVQLSLEIDDSILDEDVNWEELKSKLS